MVYYNWLVVSTYPSEKYAEKYEWVRQLGWWNCQLNVKVIKFHGSSHHQPDMCYDAMTHELGRSQGFFNVIHQLPWPILDTLQKNKFFAG